MAPDVFDLWAVHSRACSNRKDSYLIIFNMPSVAYFPLTQLRQVDSVLRIGRLRKAPINVPFEIVVEVTSYDVTTNRRRTEAGQVVSAI